MAYLIMGNLVMEDIESGSKFVEHIPLMVEDQHGHEVNFEIKTSTTLKKLKDAFCANQGRAPGSLRFSTPDGAGVNDDHTLAEFLLEDSDI